MARMRRRASIVFKALRTLRVRFVRVHGAQAREASVMVLEHVLL